MNKATAKVILDSVSPDGIRLITIHARYWHPIHAHSKTHRKIVVGDEVIEQVIDCSLMSDPNLSRNVGSSRARPSKAIIEQVRNDPWGPIHWGKNQPGMQAYSELDEKEALLCEVAWKNAALLAADSAEYMMEHGAHKQIVNRLLEPFTYVDVLLTATDWANFFALRLDGGAQPEMQDLAQAIKDAMDASTPTLLQPGEWHLPYVANEEKALLTLAIQQKLSVSRCAKISYTAFDGTVEPIDKELARYSRLIESQPMHASPCEHQATPDFIEGTSSGDFWSQKGRHGNLQGWIQLRKTLPNEYVAG